MAFLIWYSAVALAASTAAAQNFPDRHVNYDPLAAALEDSLDVSWLSAAEPVFEFGRYSNGSGSSHRWNGKIGGYVDIVRWDSTWSVAYVGMAETVIDPNNSIGFNPRSIFWEEGLLISRRLSSNSVLQLGGMQRCKHDIDNLELFYATEQPQERTLIFSGATLRLLVRPHQLIESVDWLRGALVVRNELYAHLLDHRIPDVANASGNHLDRLLSSTIVGGRLEYRPPGRRFGAHVSASGMLSVTGGRIGASDGRFENLATELSLPYLELGVDLFNPSGVGITLFARGEWQSDAAIVPEPRRAALVLFGFRATDPVAVW